VGTIASDFGSKISEVISKVVYWIDYTKVPQQLKNVDIKGLFTNPWFLVPCVLLIGYQLYKLKFRDLLIEGLIAGIWYMTGTEYMHSLVVGDKLQVEKVLPVMFGGAFVLALIIYLIFGRSD